jgi:hypothetical protein
MIFYFPLFLSIGALLFPVQTSCNPSTVLLTPDIYLDEVAVRRLDPDPVLVEGAPHYLERLRQARRGGRRDDDAVAGADAHELAAGRAEVERRVVQPPQLHRSTVY